jgi:putative SOS response-associated peptidase YedK
VRVHDLSVPGNLSRVSWKLSRTVLRGGTNSNVGPLLGEQLGIKVKQPYNFGLEDDALFAFAGLWERWRDPASEYIESFTILTTKPNSLVAGIHDRMPAILKPEDYELWLDSGVTNVALVADTLNPFDARLMKKYPVSTRVNRAENDDEECAREVPLAGKVATLF